MTRDRIGLDGRFAEIQRLVDENLERIRSVKDAGEATGMPLPDLNREFVLHTGMTVAEYLRKARIAKMKLLLESTQLKCLAIALEAGYSSEISAMRAFRNNVRMTMGNYRKSFRALQSLTAGRLTEKQPT